VIEILVHAMQLALGVWTVALFVALVRTGMELRRLRRMMESSRKLQEKPHRGG
jgi:hypothetical protein